MNNETKTRDVPTNTVHTIATILSDLGSEIVNRETTPGACGYTRLTYTTPGE